MPTEATFMAEGLVLDHHYIGAIIHEIHAGRAKRAETVRRARPGVYPGSWEASRSRRRRFGRLFVSLFSESGFLQAEGPLVLLRKPKHSTTKWWW
jgi:hypothetical protein